MRKGKSLKMPRNADSFTAKLKKRNNMYNVDVPGSFLISFLTLKEVGRLGLPLSFFFLFFLN